MIKSFPFCQLLHDCIVCIFICVLCCVGGAKEENMQNEAETHKNHENDPRYVHKTGKLDRNRNNNVAFIKVNK